MALSTWSARAAANSNASARAPQRSSVAVSSSSRIFSAPSLPPGSRVTTTSMPRSRRAAASALTWVDLPTPSPPSRLMKRPARRHAIPKSCLSPSQMRPKKPALADFLTGDQRHDLRRRVAGRDRRGRRYAGPWRSAPSSGPGSGSSWLVAPLGRPGRNGHGEIARRDQRHFAVAAQLHLRACRPWRPPGTSGFACQASKPHCISRVDSSTRALQLSRPATTSIRRRPFCSAEPVKP